VKALNHLIISKNTRIEELEARVAELEKQLAAATLASSKGKAAATGLSSSRAGGPCAACAVWEKQVERLEKEKQQLWDQLFPPRSTQPTPSGKPAVSKQASGAE
jgi:hypothetical protein